MNSYIFYLAITIVTLIVVVVNLLYLYRVTKEIKRRSDNYKNGSKVELSYQREQLENKLYDISDKITLNEELYKDVNHFMLTPNDTALILKQQVADYSFFDELGIDFAKIQVQRDMVMCLMPFHKRYDKVYIALQNACKQCGYSAIRSDNQFVSGDILKYTIELILKAQIIIAVIDGRNPNVFYEIGIAHSLGKLVILVSNIADFQSVPFDLRNNRMVLYKGATDLEGNIVHCINSFKGGEKHDSN
jgi:hypothetical protein